MLLSLLMLMLMLMLLLLFRLQHKASSQPSQAAKPKEESVEEEALVPLPSWAEPPSRKWRLEVSKDKVSLNTLYISDGKNGGAFVFGRHPNSEVRPVCGMRRE